MSNTLLSLSKKSDISKEDCYKLSLWLSFRLKSMGFSGCFREEIQVVRYDHLVSFIKRALKRVLSVNPTLTCCQADISLLFGDSYKVLTLTLE